MVDEKQSLVGGETDDRVNRWTSSWVSPAEMLVDNIDFRVKEAYRKLGKKYYSDVISLALGEFNCWFWGKSGYGDKRNGADDFALLRALSVLSLSACLAADKEDRILVQWIMTEFNDFVRFYQQTT